MNKREMTLIYELEGMVCVQREKLLAYARSVHPQLGFEDILQPQDFPSLDKDPEFRFEEGYLMGLESMLAACRALLNVQSEKAQKK